MNSRQGAAAAAVAADVIIHGATVACINVARNMTTSADHFLTITLNHWCLALLRCYPEKKNTTNEQKKQVGFGFLVEN